MNIRLVVSDIDGTLMNRNNQFSERTIRAIEKTIQSGVNFILATGRGPGLIPGPLQQIEGIRYAVVENGAGIWDLAEKKFLYRKKLEHNAAKSMLELLDGTGYVELFVNGECFIDYKQLRQLPNDFHDQNFVPYFRENHTAVENLVQATELLEETEKINFFYLGEAEEKRLLTWLRTQQTFAITSSMDGNVEVQSISENKGRALLQVCEKLSIAPSEVVAFGDGSNDFEMLEAAGMGVAMGNAGEALKTIANAVTDSNEEDGVAQFLEKYVL